jgi:hypothetical protein
MKGLYNIQGDITCKYCMLREWDTGNVIIIERIRKRDND